MTTTHTPGPWTTQPIGDETECNILGAGRELIATVADHDARLIAHAPAMLAALRKLSARKDKYGIRTDNLDIDIDDARAILRAVEG